jgi:hypothetical protein
MVWSKEQGAWEGRALRNDPVGHFSEGARLQGRIGAWSMEHGAWSKGHRPSWRTCGPWGWQHVRLNATVPAKRPILIYGLIFVNCTI